MKPEVARSIINKGGLLDKEKVSALLDYIESADRKIEQLTADRQGFKELSASYATEIGAKDSIIASRDFDIQQLNEQVRALAAENAAKQEFIKTCLQGSYLGGSAIHALGERLGLFGRETYQPALHGYICGHEAGEDSVYVMKPSPNTDAILNEVRAQAVEGFGNYCDGCYGKGEGTGRDATIYAARIRAGEVKNG